MQEERIKEVRTWPQLELRHGKPTEQNQKTKKQKTPKKESYL